MRRWIFASGLVGVLMCAEDRYAEVKSSVPPPAAVKVELPSERLNRLANDPTVRRPDRAAAIFALFKQHIKPGDSLRQVRRVLRNSSWVEEAKLYYFAFLCGWIPVDINLEDRTYSLHLFADRLGHSEWVIYFQLEGGSDWGKWNEDGIAFLQGKAGARGESKIKEFALCYPDGTIDVFKDR